MLCSTSVHKSIEELVNKVQIESKSYHSSYQTFFMPSCVFPLSTNWYHPRHGIITSFTNLHRIIVVPRKAYFLSIANRCDSPINKPKKVRTKTKSWFWWKLGPCLVLSAVFTQVNKEKKPVFWSSSSFCLPHASTSLSPFFLVVHLKNLLFITTTNHHPHYRLVIKLIPIIGK